MVPIDSSRQELSNGCYIVFWSKFDLIAEIPAAAVSDFAGYLPLPGPIFDRFFWQKMLQ